MPLAKACASKDDMQRSRTSAIEAGWNPNGRSAELAAQVRGRNGRIVKFETVRISTRTTLVKVSASHTLVSDRAVAGEGEPILNPVRVGSGAVFEDFAKQYVELGVL